MLQWAGPPTIGTGNLARVPTRWLDPSHQASIGVCRRGTKCASEDDTYDECMQWIRQGLVSTRPHVGLLTSMGVCILSSAPMQMAAGSLTRCIRHRWAEPLPMTAPEYYTSEHDTIRGPSYVKLLLFDNICLQPGTGVMAHMKLMKAIDNQCVRTAGPAQKRW